MSSNVNLPHVVQVPTEGVKEFLISEVRMSLIKSVALVQEVTPDEEIAFEKLMAGCTTSGNDLITEAFVQRQVFGGTFVREILLAYLRDLDDIILSSDAQSYFEDREFLLETVWPKKINGDDLILTAAFSAIKSLVKFAQAEDENDGIAMQLGENMFRLAVKLKIASHEQCLGTLLTSISCYLVYETDRAVKLSRTALRWSDDHPSAGVIQVVANLCFLLADIAEKKPADRLDCYEVTERLIGYLYRYHDDPALANTKAAIIEKLRHTLRVNAYLQPLAMLFFAIPGVDKPSGLPDYSQILQRLITTPGDLWINDFMQKFGGSVLTLLKARLGLALKSNDLYTNFNDWSVNYHKLYHVVPHGHSILKEKDLPNILLQLKHELVHVYSLYGVAGITLNLLRWQLAEFEIRLQGTSDMGKVKELSGRAVHELLESQEPTELESPDLMCLHFTERSALVEHKISVMEQVWLPWLEGVALFGELVEDPTFDSGIESACASVIRNLVDERMLSEGGMQPDELQHRFEDHIKMMDSHYHAALQVNGRDRLTAYLYPFFRDYLPGYLMVRKVLRCWRQALGETPLRGDQAFRILLHLTRFSGLEYIPDLSLDERSFEEAAIKGHLEWVNSLLKLEPSDIRLFLGPNKQFEQSPSAWVSGRLLTEPIALQHYEKHVEKWIKQKSKEILSAYVNEPRHAERIPDPKQRAFVRQFALEMAPASKRSIVAGQAAGVILNPNSIITLGEVEAPFWFIEPDKTLTFVLRDTADRDGSGKPWHDWAMITLEPEEAASLKTILLNSSQAYLKVRRAVVLEDRYVPEANSRQFIVLQLGDWVKSYNAGLSLQMMPEKKIADLLKSHFAGNKGLRFAKAIAAKNHPCAKRTIAWLDRFDWNKLERNGDRIDLNEWAAHTRRLAEKCLQPSSVIKDTVSQQLLHLVFNDQQLANTIYTHGLLFLRKTGLDKKTIIDFLFDSAIDPDLIESNSFTHEFFNHI